MSARSARTAICSRRTAASHVRLHGGLPVFALLLAGLLLRALIPVGDMIVMRADGGLAIADCPGGHMRWSPKSPARSHYRECPFAAAVATAPPSLPPGLPEPPRLWIGAFLQRFAAAVPGAFVSLPPATGPPTSS